MRRIRSTLVASSSSPVPAGEGEAVAGSMDMRRIHVRLNPGQDARLLTHAAGVHDPWFLLFAGKLPLTVAAFPPLVTAEPLTHEPTTLAAALHAPGPLACLRVGGNRWVVARGPFTSAAEPPPSGIAVYVNDFALSEAQPWRIPAAAWEVTGEPKPPEAPLQVDWRPLARGDFETALEEVLAGLQVKRWSKAILSVAERGQVTLGDPAMLGRRALAPREQAACWPYLFDEGHLGGFAGNTPECLFTIQGNRLHTMALAGTARPVERAHFEADAKEIHEHQIVVDGLHEKVRAWGEVKAGPREILNIGGLIHFITRFEVRVGEVNVNELLRTLHPTPAIGILPRTEGNLAALARWRGRLAVPSRFGAPFGVQWSGGLHMVVAIRGVWWSGNDVWLPAGCGIVKGSGLEREWRELSLKRRWVKQALGLPS